MTVKKVWAVYFSGTGTTKKTVDRIAHRLAEALGTDCEVYDYTLPAARRQELTIPSGDVAVVGCPTYAGRVPNLLMPYLHQDWLGPSSQVQQLTLKQQLPRSRTR